MESLVKRVEWHLNGKPLFPFSPWNLQHKLITLPNKKGGTCDRVSDVFCPSCAQNGLTVAPSVCHGRTITKRSGWWLWQTAVEVVTCPEHRPHFHVHCSECGWATLMETYEAWKERP